MQFLKIFLYYALFNNIVLVFGYGMCSFLGVSNKKENALNMGIMVCLVTFISSIICYFLNMLLIKLELEFLQTIIFSLVIAFLVQILDILVKKFSINLYNSLGIYLPLLTTNCIVLYVCKQSCNIEPLLSNIGVNITLNNALEEIIYVSCYSLSIGIGYLLIIYIFSFIRERIKLSSISKIPNECISLIILAILSLLMSGLN